SAIAELIYSTDKYRNELEKILGVKGPRDKCEFDSWDFLSGRPPVESIFGDPESFMNIAEDSPVDANGVYTLSPPIIGGSSNLTFSKTVKAGFVDSIALSLAAGSPATSCYSDLTSSFSSPCPNE